MLTPEAPVRSSKYGGPLSAGSAPGSGGPGEVGGVSSFREQASATRQQRVAAIQQFATVRIRFGSGQERVARVRVGCVLWNDNNPTRHRWSSAGPRDASG